MKLQKRISIYISSLVISSLIVLAAALFITAKSEIENALVKEFDERLVGIRDAQKHQIESYFSTIQNQVITLASSTMTQDAMRDFTSAFQTFEQDVRLPVSQEDITRSLNNYYQDEFGKKYREMNEGRQVNTHELIQSLSENAKTIQYIYISGNKFPLGEKDKLINAENPSRHNQFHEKYHPSYRQFLYSFGYYDIFLVDLNGNVVYTVFKELDFATSLTNGAYKNSGLANTFKRAVALSSGESVLVDFEPYSPSYESPASFIGTPIVSEGRTIGVLIFQMPIERINSIMTFNKNWHGSGMGNSGETYLVGQDIKMRSNSRFLIEAPNEFFKAVQGNFESSVIDEMKSKETTIGLQTVNTESVQRALKGNSGITLVKDYRGVDVISAYTPLNISGVNWVLLSEIDKDEAFSSLGSLESALTVTGLVIALILGIVSFLLSIIMAKSIARPINQMISFINNSASNLDFSNRYQITKTVEANDEIRDLAISFNTMVGSVESTVKDVKQASSVLLKAVSELMSKFEEAKNKSAEQSNLTVQISAAIEQLAMTSKRVAEIANQTSEMSNEGVEKSNAGRDLVIVNQQNSETLVNEMSSTNEVMKQLEEQTSNIGKVLEVIVAIAEQTNLLALNAAIEAARAGEQGRGFAVVADEVRTLAKRTQDSTGEISQIIRDLQSGSKVTVASIQEANERAEDTKRIAHDVGGALNTIIGIIQQIEAYNTEVNTAASEQSHVTEDMSQRISAVTVLAEDNRELMDEAEKRALWVSEKSRELENMVKNYKVS
ncbi:methyl-accepting chemotaxis protein [Paraneptunicella aestuarii]|uniref:methyl-accepting chemotaxis protein n=1 Tax=Paraneptunicella aestuarii TaxID=2831148 RepID=UPI001E2A14E5|nr:methyl-accepting chemotaxis protein [Paraneptunicella aestuarii]UAA40594.1 methyl-accepting chemotaxis protein [Paraneptunicella aestuarii]